MQERENILRIFKESKEAFLKDDSTTIKLLSDQTNNTASLTQDPDNITTAVIVYALSKIVERKEYYKSLPGWNKFYKTHLDSITKKIDALERKDDNAFRKELVRIRKAIEDLSGKLGQYVQDVFRKAEINRASKLYEHGISMERTSKLLGITLYELASYLGEKEISEKSEVKTIGVKERIKYVEDIFR